MLSSHVALAHVSSHSLTRVTLHSSSRLALTQAEHVQKSDGHSSVATHGAPSMTSVRTSSLPAASHSLTLAS
jgi:hypothetical protein